MTTLDSPSREACVMRRERTNSPMQSLLLLNEPQFVEAGLALGRKMLDEGGGTPASRIAHGFRLATGRAPNPEEIDLLERSFTRHLQRFGQDPDAASDFAGSPELAAHAMIGTTLLNLDETINRP